MNIRNAGSPEEVRVDDVAPFFGMSELLAESPLYASEYVFRYQALEFVPLLHEHLDSSTPSKLGS